ncbi:hypothetical protein CPB86DRAFT_729775 [Serendipita vermifera]|nr:hypothetical protein CPB86DRAFT_729775 [Serendipita vermifera]
MHTPFRTLVLIPRTLSIYNAAFSRRSYTTASIAKPWFVDEEPELPKPQTTERARIELPKDAKDAPKHVQTAFTFLAQSPLIEPSTLALSHPLSAEEQPDGDLPLPLLKKVQKSRGKQKERGYGRGVGEGPGQGVYLWELVAQVRQGSEVRGGVEVVASSLRQMLKREYPGLLVPSRSNHKDQRDGWTMIDLGNSAIHICSRRAWQLWMDPSREW